MKKLNSIFLMMILFASMVALLSCNENEVLSASDKMKKLLIGNGAKTWKLKTVTVDDTDQTIKYTGMTIKFSDTGYITSNGGLIWTSPGTWEFTDSKATAFYRTDGIEVKITATESQLNLSLKWTKKTLGGGRAVSVAGNHVFVFTI